MLKLGFHERRIGSSLCADSKLEIKRTGRAGLFSVNFKPNFEAGKEDPDGVKKTEQMKGNFISKVDEYLALKGIGKQL